MIDLFYIALAPFYAAAVYGVFYYLRSDKTHFYCGTGALVAGILLVVAWHAGEWECQLKYDVRDCVIAEEIFVPREE